MWSHFDVLELSSHVQQFFSSRCAQMKLTVILMVLCSLLFMQVFVLPRIFKLSKRVWQRFATEVQTWSGVQTQVSLNGRLEMTWMALNLDLLNYRNPYCNYCTLDEESFTE